MCLSRLEPTPGFRKRAFVGPHSPVPYVRHPGFLRSPQPVRRDCKRCYGEEPDGAAACCARTAGPSSASWSSSATSVTTRIVAQAAQAKRTAVRLRRARSKSRSGHGNMISPQGQGRVRAAVRWERPRRDQRGRRLSSEPDELTGLLRGPVSSAQPHARPAGPRRHASRGSTTLPHRPHPGEPRP